MCRIHHRLCGRAELKMFALMVVSQFLQQMVVCGNAEINQSESTRTQLLSDLHSLDQALCENTFN